MWPGRLWVAALVVAASIPCLAEAQGTPTPAPIPGFVACTYPLDAAPIAMTTADFNHDGNPDVAVVNSNNVAVLITTAAEFAQGNCLGAITPTTFDLPAGSAPKAVAAGDIDQDGIIDIAVAVSAGVVLAHGKGDGSFAPIDPPLPAGVDPRALVIADVDGDGRPDIVVANGNGTGVSILYGRTTGFEPVVSLSLGAPITSMLVDSLNPDPFLDIVAVSNFAGEAFVLLQDSSMPRTFTTLPAVSVGLAPTGITGGDFDGNGSIDLAVTSGGANGLGKLGIYLNQVQESQTTPFVQSALVNTGAALGTNPSALGVADFNRDGLLDAVVANQGDASVPFFLGNGSGEVSSVPGNCGTAGGNCVVGVAPNALAVADVDGDGRPDVITADQAGVSLTFLLSSKPGPTPSPTPTTTATPSPTTTVTPSATPTFGGDCCVPHDGPGCAPAACESCVSGLSGFCHTDQWDDLCVQLANEDCASVCGCGAPTPTPTDSPSPTETLPPTDTPTMTPTGPPPPTATASATPTRTINSTYTPTPSATATPPSTNTPSPGITPTPTSQCFAAGVCISGSSCAVASSAHGSQDIGVWLLPPLLVWLRRRRSR